ncbi:cilium assembly protein DZIP1L [Osmerus eperlanus]|uniref:cilium assembly protein DZIP1L n=1 Tax=Osmerus eperlanus TaxID=29151 RepID=UPI002E1503D8
MTMPGQLPPVEPLHWASPPSRPLRFRPRTEAVDWRRVSALDVDRVALEMDVGVLQEFISAVTFCDVSGERCPHCRNPAEPALLKVLRMSQLSTEYLLHCQDYLSSQVCSLEQRLQGALSRAEEEAEERARRTVELQAAQQESRRRKKIISTQQFLLQASSNSYHKCQFCEKSFVNYSYLQAHLQRRHPEVTGAERQKKRQVEEGMQELRERLELAQRSLEAEREADALRRQQALEEQRRKEALEQEKLESWKEEERKKFQEEMRDLRQLFLQEFRDMASRSSSIETKLQELQTREVTASTPGYLQDELQQREKELRVKLSQQKSEWKKKFKEIQNRHLLEKEELQTETEKLRSMAADHSPADHSPADHSPLQRLHQQVRSFSRQARQQDQLLRAQDETIRKLSARHIPVKDAPVQQIVQQSTAAQDKEEESEEEEQQGYLFWKSQVAPPYNRCSCLAEVEDSEETRRRVLESLRRNPGLGRELRPLLVSALEEKLENMGVRKGTKGISQKSFSSLSVAVSGQRQLRFRQVSNLPGLREALAKQLARRVRRLQKMQTTSEHHASASQAQSRSPPTLPSSRKTEKVPVTQQTSKPHQQKNRTPPFSSDEESVEDSAYVTSPGSRSAPSVRVVRSGPRPPAPPTDDWSDSDLSERLSAPSAYHGRAVQGAFVKSLTRSLERQLSSPGTKPPGGVRVGPPPAGPPKPKPRSAVRHLQLSEEESDLELSSIEEILPAGGAVRGGQGSTEVGGTSGTSVWSSSNSRAGGL